MKKVLFIFLICVHAIISKTQTIHTDNQLRTNIDTAVQNAIIPFMNNSSRVGLSIGVYNNGKVYTYNYGSLQKGKQTLPDKSTIYEIGSITKTFTGILLAQAVNDKKVRLEDEVPVGI
jgi:D-alanyl-D-alanine-carboxypeptidase/D-alanyl-D-alanine-endopeptidase